MSGVLERLYRAGEVDDRCRHFAPRSGRLDAGVSPRLAPTLSLPGVGEVA